MRDVYALVNSASQHPCVLTPKQVIKALGRRGSSITEKRVAYSKLQPELLKERIVDMLRDIQVAQKMMNPQNVAQNPDNTEEHSIQHSSSPKFYPSPLRPLMLETDHLSTVFAALDQEYLNGGSKVGLHPLCDFIHGRYLVKDDQMATQTMLELRESMATPDRLCILVNCEPLFVSLLDVLNGLFQRDEDYSEGSLLTVRVVVDGRSEYWPVTPNFCVEISSPPKSRSATGSTRISGCI